MKLPGSRKLMGVAISDMLMQPTEGGFAGGLVQKPVPEPIIPQKTGLFTPGSKGALIAGILGDGLAQASGGRAVFMPAMLQERQQQQKVAHEEAQWSRRRQAEREDKQWEWQNKPREDDAFTRSLRAAGIDPASETGRSMYLGRVQNETDPIVTTTLPNGQFYSGPRSGLAAAITGQAPTAPAAPVGKLTPIGGGAGNGAGGFPVR